MNPRNRILLATAVGATIALAGATSAAAVGESVKLTGCETLTGTKVVPGWLRYLNVTLDGDRTQNWTNPDSPNFDDPSHTVSIDFGYVAPGEHSYTVVDSNGQLVSSHTIKVTVPACPTPPPTTAAPTTAAPTTAAPTTAAPTTVEPTPSTVTEPTYSVPRLPDGVAEETVPPAVSSSVAVASSVVVASSAPPATQVVASTQAAAQSTATANTLPATGSNNTPLIGMGVAFLLVGGIATATTHRRRPVAR